jgi:RNA polymerase sigma factor (sigma-70 family)
VVLSLRRYGGLDLDPGAAGVQQREEARRVNELDRSELDQVIQNALMDVLRDRPRPFPRRFFPWLKNVLAHRALDHVYGEITESRQHLPYDEGIQYVLHSLLTGDGRGAGFFASPASPAHASWLSTLDLPKVFELAHEYASYARTRTACEKALERLPDRQRQVIQQCYFESMTLEQIVLASGIAASSVRNTHRGAITNLRGDDVLFDVLEAVGGPRCGPPTAARARERAPGGPAATSRWWLDPFHGASAQDPVVALDLCPQVVGHDGRRRPDECEGILPSSLTSVEDPDRERDAVGVCAALERLCWRTLASSVISPIRRSSRSPSPTTSQTKRIRASCEVS